MVSLISLLVACSARIVVDRQTDKQTNRQTDKQTNRQTDKQTNRQTDKQTNRQTHRPTTVTLAAQARRGLMRSGHKSNAVCTVIMKHFNAQYLTIALSFVTILYTALVSWTDIVQGLRLYSHFVDHSPLNSVHDITTCMNVHGRYIILERLKHMHKQQAVFVSVFTCKVLCFAETGLL